MGDRADCQGGLRAGVSSAGGSVSDRLDVTREQSVRRTGDALVRLDRYRFRSIGEATDVYGVVRLPVWPIRSRLHAQRGGPITGIDAVYLPLPAAHVYDCIIFARAIGRGASVTSR